MRPYLATIVLVIFSAVSLHAEECTQQTYKTLVTDGKAANDERQWGRAVEVYSRIIGDCAPQVNSGDLVKAYDSLSVAQLMTESYSAAIDSAKKCIEMDSKYNACMMTAAKAYENLGDREMAISFARSAAEVEPYDEYSSAVVILANDFLRRIQRTGR